MRDVTRYNLYGDRSVKLTDSMSFVGFDFTGATLRAQVREKPDPRAALLIDLGQVIDTSEGVRLFYSGSDTVANHITAGRISTDIYDYVNQATGTEYAAGDVIDLSIINVYVDAATIDSLANTAVVGADLVLAWDLLITPVGDVEDKYIAGSFTIRGSCTQ